MALLLWIEMIFSSPVLHARRLQAKQQRAEQQASRAKYAADLAECRPTIYISPAGELGPTQLRSTERFRLPRHQETFSTRAGAYPFPTEGGLGSDDVFISQDLFTGGTVAYDPWVLYRRGIITAPDVVLASIVGTGKPSVAKSLYTRSIPFRRRVYLPDDPKGEHTAIDTALTEVVQQSERVSQSYVLQVVLTCADDDFISNGLLIFH